MDLSRIYLAVQRLKSDFFFKFPNPTFKWNFYGNVTNNYVIVL